MLPAEGPFAQTGLLPTLKQAEHLVLEFYVAAHILYDQS
jgi:hypothetical protein